MVITPEWPLGKFATGWPNMAYVSAWNRREAERRREFLDRHCTHLLTTGTEHQWSIYRVNSQAAASAEGVSAPGARAAPATTDWRAP